MIAGGAITGRVFRYEPGSGDTPRYETFSVPARPNMRVLDVLTCIFDDDKAASLAHRWYCGTKKCGECAVTVDGKPVLACWEAATQGMTIGPLVNFPIIRDLVVDTEPYEQLILGLQPIIRREHSPSFPEPIGHSRMLPAHNLLKCIECNVCTASVPVTKIGAAGIDRTDDAGPAALVRFARFALDPRDELDRVPLARKGGLQQFPLYDVLHQVCPQGIDIVADAIAPTQQKLFGTTGKPATGSATAVLVVARSWSAFVRLTETGKQELQKAGLIRTATFPGVDEAYFLVEA